MREESSQTTVENKSKVPIFLVAALFIIGLPVAFYGITANEPLASMPGSTSLPNTPEVFLPGDESARKALLARADQLQKEQCSGCHSQSQALTGPSFDDIANSIPSSMPGSREIPAGDTASSDPTTVDRLSALAAAINHPYNGWPSYARGPSLDLPETDRLALAYWIATKAKVPQ